MNGKLTVKDAFERVLDLIQSVREKQWRMETKISRLELQNLAIQQENKILHEQLEELNKRLSGYRRF